MKKPQMLIPKLEGDIWTDYPVVGKPGWFAITKSGRVAKPLIRCNCGCVTGIGLHHVHPDGTITASFWHKRGTTPPEDPNGCEWHVWLKLENWSGEDIPPDAITRPAA